jgi:glycosyltransferase involved in cell wall biosynthesis
MKICIIIPAYNEEKIIEGSVIKLKNHLDNLNYDYEIVIAENNSTDSTFEKALEMASKYNNVKVSVTKGAGRGRALNKVIRESNADIIGYMDADLSTDISAIPKFVESIQKGAALAIGSRHLPDSEVKRGLKRTVLSKGYNFMANSILNLNVKDTQCGFKFFHKNSIREILPLIKDEKWFWDTELIYNAKKKGYDVTEIPVAWIEDKDSKVKIINTSIGYLARMFELRHRKNK